MRGPQAMINFRLWENWNRLYSYMIITLWITWLRPAFLLDFHLCVDKHSRYRNNNEAFHCSLIWITKAVHEWVIRLNDCNQELITCRRDRPTMVKHWLLSLKFANSNSAVAEQFVHLVILTCSRCSSPKDGVSCHFSQKKAKEKGITNYQV